jgi:hypothetical protein
LGSRGSDGTRSWPTDWAFLKQHCGQCCHLLTVIEFDPSSLRFAALATLDEPGFMLGLGAFASDPFPGVVLRVAFAWHAGGPF